MCAQGLYFAVSGRLPAKSHLALPSHRASAMQIKPGALKYEFLSADASVQRVKRFAFLFNRP